jgi:hypothetical protein
MKNETEKTKALTDAAPELLAALEAILRDCNLKIQGHGGRMDKAIEAGHAAIAKAIGN